MKDEAIDLGGIIPQDETIKEILKPGGTEGTGWMITLAGPAHPKAVAWTNEISKRNLRRQQRIEAAQVNGRKFVAEDREVDDVRRENVEWAVSRIVGWSPAVKIGAETYPFSDAVAIELLSRPSMGWAFAQIVEWIGDERSFTKASAKA
ncbi:hypothetical protein [Mesorhizobium sp. B263B2A]|uniref:hypothetical protein n=1 Tax=Mesorhizobium sp. B263B2A TaxID=2876669 RepID=UPI001CD0F182|nr:hypothetical protein [Mesorhizobium sp. B263B2A]MCA0032766.1 hypothetical protein [Mesorhizobium sp. B263B2A]